MDHTLMKLNQFPTIQYLPVLLFLVVTYVLFLSQYYYDIADIPDFFLYNYFANQGLRPVDGFSSLFMYLSQFIVANPDAFRMAALFSLATSIFIMNYLFFKQSDSKRATILFVAFNFSCGIWYYFFGKVFHDFPFVALSASLALLAFSYVSKNKLMMLIFSFSLGFCLSWKPHAIFAVTGVLLLANRQFDCRTIFGEKSPYFIAFLISAFGIALLVGFVAGNFTFLSDFSGTVNGLWAYKDFIWSRTGTAGGLLEHFFSRDRLVWDHVGLPPFVDSVVNIFSFVIVLFVLPILNRDNHHLLINMFMLSAYLVFIHFFSPGWPWHSLSFGYFIILTYGLALLRSVSPNRLFTITSVAAVILQFGSNFFSYVPTQAQWFSAAEDARATIIENASEINSNVSSLAESIDGCFEIDLRYKFKKIFPDGFAQGIPKEWGIRPDLEGDRESFDKIRAMPNHISQFKDCSAGNVLWIMIEPHALREIASYRQKSRLEIERFHFEQYDLIRGASDDELFSRKLTYFDAHLAQENKIVPNYVDTVINGFELGYFYNELLRNYRGGFIPEYRINEIEKKFPDWKWDAVDRDLSDHKMKLK
jgi:hypothetical protein